MKHFFLGTLCIPFLLSACSSTLVRHDGAPKRRVDVSHIKSPTPKRLHVSRYGNPDTYTVLGKTYHTRKTGKGYDKVGYASWYGTKFHGHRTSSGEPYDMYAMSAANKVLPIPCYVKVTNLENHRAVIVKVNDRGPFKDGRIIDLSYVAALKLGVFKHGTAKVRVQYIDPDMNVKQVGFKNLTIQAGAFYNKSNALKRMLLLTEKLKTSVYLTHSIVNHKKLYRVNVGPIKTVKAADWLVIELRTLGVKQPLFRAH
jgi:rare lipoprotein A